MQNKLRFVADFVQENLHLIIGASVMLYIKFMIAS